MIAPVTESPASVSDDVVVTLVGDVGPHDLLKAAGELEWRGDGARRAVLDLHRVRSITLFAIDPLLEAASSLRQRGIEVRVTPGWAEATFQLTGCWLAEPLSRFPE